MAPSAVIWRPHVDSELKEVCPPCPLVKRLRSREHFRCGVERAKGFVNMHLHCIISNLESIGLSKISSLLPLEKFLRTPVLLT